MSTDEINENTYQDYKYTQTLESIFDNFKHILDAVQIKSEILENHNEQDLKIEENYEDFEIVSYDEYYVKNEELHKQNTKIDNNESKNIEVDKHEGMLKQIDTSTCCTTNEYGKSILMFGTKQDTCQFKLKPNREVNHNENIVLSKDTKMTRNKQKSNVMRNEEFELNSYKDSDDNWGQSYESPGLRNVFGLDVTVEDIEKGILMTEKLLEDYNIKRLGLNKKQR